MLHRIRLGMSLQHKRFGTRPKMGGTDGGPVEVDETFIGGSLKNMHKEKRARYDMIAGSKGKTVVMGMLDRNTREVRAKVVPDVKRDTLQAEILKNIKYGSAVYTDEWYGYSEVRYRFVHDVVKHSETYVKGQVHTQGIENFWSLLKRTLRGTYVAVEPYHLDRYLDEQIFRYNNRATKENPLTDADRFSLALTQIANKRLTYAELTGKTAAGASTAQEPF
jgi:transposase-like protein